MRTIGLATLVMIAAVSLGCALDSEDDQGTVEEPDASVDDSLESAGCGDYWLTTHYGCRTGSMATYKIKQSCRKSGSIYVGREIRGETCRVPGRGNGNTAWRGICQVFCF